MLGLGFTLCELGISNLCFSLIFFFFEIDMMGLDFSW